MYSKNLVGVGREAGEKDTTNEMWVFLLSLKIYEQP